MRFEGTLTRWNEERGFGFIAPDQGGDEIFVHLKSITNLKGRPAPAQRFSFEIEPGPQGKGKRARHVLPVQPARAIRPPARPHPPAQWGTATLFVIPDFLALCLALAVWWRPPFHLALLYAGMYAGMSLLTFVAYAADKRAAASNARRTPENTLHLLALAGGWPGALLAQQWLRHKSSKGAFRSVFWLTVGVNVALLVWLCSPLGRQLLQRGAAL